MIACYGCDGEIYLIVCVLLELRYIEKKLRWNKRWEPFIYIHAPSLSPVIDKSEVTTSYHLISTIKTIEPVSRAEMWILDV